VCKCQRIQNSFLVGGEKNNKKKLFCDYFEKNKICGRFVTQT
jgi:hypothetical protein